MSYAALVQKLTTLQEAASPRRWRVTIEPTLGLVDAQGNDIADFFRAEDAALAEPAHEMGECVEALVEEHDAITAAMGECDGPGEGLCDVCTRLTALATALGVEVPA